LYKKIEEETFSKADGMTRIYCLMRKLFFDLFNFHSRNHLQDVPLATGKEQGIFKALDCHLNHFLVFGV